MHFSLGVTTIFFSFKIKEQLGYKPTELKSSVIDMAYNLIEAGFIKKTPQYEEMKNQKSASGSQ